MNESTTNKEERMMKRRLAVLLLIWSPLACFAPMVASAQTDDELYAAAKVEGTVNFAGALKQKETDQLLRDFEKRYPGVHATYTRRATEPMVQLIEADRLSGKTSFDVINLTEPGEMLRYKREGFLARTEPVANDQLLPGTFDPEGMFRAYGVTPMYGIVNTDKLKPGDRPTTLAELFTPKWKSKVVISQPSRGGTDSAALMNVAEAIGPDFLGKVKDLDLLLTRGNEAAISAVISGERPISWGVSGYRVLEARADGSPVDIVFWKEGTALASFYGAVVAKAPHPNAARLLERWFMSKPVQDQVVKRESLYSARRDVAATPLDELPLSKLPIRFYTSDEVAKSGQALALGFDQALGVK
jgi:iron(III) transport system substrate-binding protein